MGSHPLAALSSAERATYRTALTAQVIETIYRAWQQGSAPVLDEIVLAVRVMRLDAPTVEVHRAVASVEYAGIIAPVDDPSERWRLVDEPRRLPSPLVVCPTPECLRPAGHTKGHLPDLRGDRFTAQLVVRDEDFIAAWAPGSPWVHVYRSADDWDEDNDPVAVLPVPHTIRFTSDALTDLVTAWASSDTNAPATTGTVGRPFVYEPGVDNGILVYQHADFFATWHHDRGEVWFYSDAVDWDDDDYNTIDRVAVSEDAPFTGAVLDQLCDDWFTRQVDKESEQQHDPTS